MPNYFSLKCVWHEYLPNEIRFFVWNDLIAKYHPPESTWEVYLKDGYPLRQSTWLSRNKPQFIHTWKYKSHNDQFYQKMLKYFKHYQPTNKCALSPATEPIFKIRDNSKPLLETKSKIFHGFISKVLYL